jgi:hypothetical protein
MVKKFCVYLLSPKRLNCKMFGIEYVGCDWCKIHKFYENKYVYIMRRIFQMTGCLFGFHNWQYVIWHETGKRRKNCINCRKRLYY